MHAVTPRRGKTNFPQRLRHCSVLLTLPLIFTYIWLKEFKQEQLQAQALPTQPTQITTNRWQHASFPVENFQAYTSGFGYRKSPTSGKLQFHRGLDMAAPVGSYVRNWWTGYVVELSDNTACGIAITIQSGKWKHIYCHLSGQIQTTAGGTYLLDRQGGIQLKQGQRVSVGARIGRVGMTGRTTGPHLHWGLTYENKYVDPALVLREMHRQQTISRIN